MDDLDDVGLNVNLDVGCTSHKPDHAVIKAQQQEQQQVLLLIKQLQQEQKTSINEELYYNYYHNITNTEKEQVAQLLQSCDVANNSK